MKSLKTIKKSLLAIIVCTAIWANATELSTFSVAETLKEAKETALTLKNVKPGNLLSIKDANGITLYKELIKTAGTYRKGFDLTALPSGDYFFEINKDLEIKTIPFTVTSNTVVFDKKAEFSVFKPYVRQKDDLVLISKLAPKKSPLEIKVYSEVNGLYQLTYAETISDMQTIERTYKLSEGDYKIVFKSNNKTFTKFINN